ncbi:MAG: hypothetical protein JW863_21570 [Chitinispirillaceae bacterium]|nr:hypothetical protein [Chitinispirillaceae bacterium]
MISWRRGFSVVLLLGMLVSSSFGIAGIGIHWGNDFTLHMEDKDEWVAFEDLNIDTAGITGTLPNALLSGISGSDLPIYISRTDWRNTRINGGLKVFIDVIPVLDAVELSTNFGLWEYDGSITYPTGLEYVGGANYANVTNPEELFTPEYDTLPITLENYDAGFGGLRKTPYMKLQFDLTIRKYIAQLPPVVKILKLYGGGGISLSFATPVLSKSLIEDALGESIEGVGNLDDLTNLFSEQNTLPSGQTPSEAIVKELLGRLMTPHFGMHIDLGVMVKIPVIPLGVYVDGKFMIPFGDMDKYVDIGGLGILLNSGISLTF